jgi:poly(hydroxyalkanoate) depolymerase family esterase
MARTCCIGVVALLSIASTGALATSIPNETDWARGSNWKYESNFAGFPHAWVYTPNSYSLKAAGKRAALIHLIGCGQLPFQAAQNGGFPEAAEAYGMVVVIPDIIAPAKPNNSAQNIECYNYGGGYPIATMPTRTSADHKAIIAAGTRMASDYPELKIDPNQIYLSGLSAGGTVAMEVACMAADVFAGAASSVAAGMGSNQSQAIMPPSIGESNIVKTCRDYANASPTKTPLRDQVFAIISDNNSLPAGNITVIDGQITADKFAKQTIWDGDKFCPHAYQEMTANALATLLNVRKSETNQPVASGRGLGCVGGEASRDEQYVECLTKDAVARNWEARADYWRDAAGRARVVRIEQDTLRHTWPAGPAGAGDVHGTPDWQWLDDHNYIDHATGSFNAKALSSAPNGVIGSLYQNPMAMDFPMFIAKLWTENNPKLGSVPSPNTPEVSAASAVDTINKKITVSGAASAKAEDTVIASIDVLFLGTHVPATFNPGRSVTYSVDIDAASLSPGAYSARVTATDSAGALASIDASFVVPGAPTPPAPTPSCVSARVSEHISDGRAHKTDLSTALAVAYANGSNDKLGYLSAYYDPMVAIHEDHAGYWVKVLSCPK